MEKQNLKTTLLQTQQNQNLLKQQQSQFQEEQKRVKKRMTSMKNPPSQYKNTLNKIFCHYYPIQQNQTLDTKCQAQLGFLFIGGSGVIDSQVLKKHNIRAVLTVLDFKKYDKENLGQKIEDINQVQQHQFIDVSQDHVNIGPYLDHSFDFISDVLSNGMNLLVHSHEGLSRSPAIVINYLMRKYKLKFDQAYQIVKFRKPEIDLKPNLVDQLKNLKY